MKVLIIGTGAREHALAWRLSRSDSVTEVFAAPGNPGIASLGTCFEVDANNPEAVSDLARRVGADLVIVGPEAPLVAGVADACRAAGIATFGPSSAAAQLEGSKAFAKGVMDRAGVPTAAYANFSDPEAAIEFLDTFEAPYVIKADGLAAGKGVTVAATRDEATDAIRASFEGAFGEAGSRIVIEEFLRGEEASLFCITDGEELLPLAGAQDFKRIGDGDTGPNTGGMGSYSPVPHLQDLIDASVEVVCRPTVKQMSADGVPFQGLLYAGLMIDKTVDGGTIGTVEFNCRFGDPETQVVLPRLEGDFGLLLASAASGKLESSSVSYSEKACVCVVLASGGYPGVYEVGKVISGIDEAEGDPQVTVFHAGTKLEDGVLKTAGGRVLAVSALGSSIASARARAYEACEKIDFEGKTFRTDIAAGR